MMGAPRGPRGNLPAGQAQPQPPKNVCEKSIEGQEDRVREEEW